MEELALRMQAVEVRRIRGRVDRTKYNAPSLSREQDDRLATVYSELTKAAQELDKVAQEVEEAKWGKESAQSKTSGKRCAECGSQLGE